MYCIRNHHVGISALTGMFILLVLVSSDPVAADSVQHFPLVIPLMAAEPPSGVYQLAQEPRYGPPFKPPQLPEYKLPEEDVERLKDAQDSLKPSPTEPGNRGNVNFKVIEHGLADGLVPKARVARIAEGVYQFTAWVEGSRQVLGQIELVEYTFNHISFKQKILSSTDRNRNFLIQYSGWGCLDVVPITITSTSASTEGGKLLFSMCREIGWQ